MNDAENADFILALIKNLKPHLAGGLNTRPFGRENKKELAKWVQEVFKCASAGGLIKTVRGKNGGTWAHWQIALAYAKYLSPELHMWANQVVKERLEEERNPELGITRSRERAINAWRRQGKSDEWIEARLKGIATRKVFTGILARHGVQGQGFAQCTNVYLDIADGLRCKYSPKVYIVSLESLIKLKSLFAKISLLNILPGISAPPIFVIVNDNIYLVNKIIVFILKCVNLLVDKTYTRDIKLRQKVE